LTSDRMLHPDGIIKKPFGEVIANSWTKD